MQNVPQVIAARRAFFPILEKAGNFAGLCAYYMIKNLAFSKNDQIFRYNSLSNYLLPKPLLRCIPRAL